MAKKDLSKELQKPSNVRWDIFMYQQGLDCPICHCPACGTPIYSFAAFYTDTRVGLISPACKCGADNGGVVVFKDRATDVTRK